MKVKKLLYPMLAAAMLLALSSCVSSGKVVETVFDPSVPESRSAKILFWLDVETYNGIDVREAWGKDNNIPLVTIPQGEAAFTFTAYFARDYGRTIYRYTISDCDFRYKFEGGREYTVRWFLEKKPKKFLAVQEYNYYIQIYGRLPKDLQDSNYSDLKESDLLTQIFIFDTEDYKN